jgi:hypothetical protein
MISKLLLQKILKNQVDNKVDFLGPESLEFPNSKSQITNSKFQNQIPRLVRPLGIWDLFFFGI